MDLEPDFDEFCALLLDRRVEFVIVGAHALAVHGAPRFTGDLDVLVRPTTENAGRLIAAIHSFGFPDIPMTPEQLVSPRTVLEMRVAPVQIHVMSAVDGVTWDEVWEGRIGRAEFIKNKRAAGRLKDLADIDALSDSED